MTVRRDDYRSGYWVQGEFVSDLELKTKYGLKTEPLTMDNHRIAKPKKPEFFGGKKMKTLYRYTVDGNEVIGERLAIDGSRWVMKRMDTAGTVEVVDPKLCSEVLPYTVDVRFVEDNTRSTGPWSFFAVEGSVEVGALLKLKGYHDYAEVVAVDSKSKKATKALDGWTISNNKLPTVDN